MLTLQEPVAKLLSKNEKLKTESKQPIEENLRQKAEIGLLTEQVQEKIKENYFKENKLFQFYTGLQDYVTFKTLLDSFGPAVNNLVYHDTTQILND